MAPMLPSVVAADNHKKHSAGVLKLRVAFASYLPAVTQQATRTAQKKGFENMFEYEMDVRQIIQGEFELQSGSEILRKANCEARDLRNQLRDYADLILEAEGTLLYGEDACDVRRRV